MTLLMLQHVTCYLFSTTSRELNSFFSESISERKLKALEKTKQGWVTRYSFAYQYGNVDFLLRPLLAWDLLNVRYIWRWEENSIIGFRSFDLVDNERMTNRFMQICMSFGLNVCGAFGNNSNLLILKAH